MRNVLIAALMSTVAAGAVFAQTTPPATKTPPAKAATTKPRTPESIECSKQADAKGLHGKEREKFRAQCKKQLTKKT
jgi:hypothetical protein